MNDTDRGGMTVSSLLVMGLTASVTIPVVAIIVLGIFRGIVDQTVFVFMVWVCALVVLLGILMVNYVVRRKIQNRLLGLIDFSRNFPSGISLCWGPLQVV